MFDIAGPSMLETSMTRTAEDAGGDLTADLAALRQDVARLAETMSELVQHETKAVGIRASAAVGDARDKIASTAADAQNRVRGERRNRGQYQAQSVDGGADRFRHRHLARHDEPMAWLIVHDPRLTGPWGAAADGPCAISCSASPRRSRMLRRSAQGEVLNRKDMRR